MSTVRLTRSVSTVPKSTEGLRSSRNQAVISRSSVYWRIRRVQPGGDVPVHGADVVARLVLAESCQVDAAPVEQAAVVALEQAVEPADHVPVESLEDALRRRYGRGTPPAAAHWGPGCA